MLGFNPGTQPVAMKEWVTPLDPSIYAQGVANQTKKLEAQSAQDSELYNSFMNIQAIASQDEEQLQTLKQSFEKELSGLSMGDLRNPQTKAQLSQIQNKYTNLLLESGIPHITHIYQKDIKEVKDLEAKGKFVPAWKMKPLVEAQKYIQDGNFYKDARFNGQIQAGFDWDKHNKTLIDSTPEYHELKKGKQTNDLYQGKTYNSLYGKFFEGLNQPGALDDLKEQFEYTYGNEDFATQDYNTAVEQVNRLSNIIQTSNNPILVEQAKKDLDYWDDFTKSVNPQISKEDAFQRYIKANAEDFARTNTNYALKESKINDVYKMQQDHAHSQAMKAEKESLAMYGIKKAIDATIASGQTPDYEAIQNGDYSSLIYNPIESRDGKSGTSTGGKTVEQKVAEDAAKAEEERIKKIPIVTTAQVQQEFSSNKDFQNNFKKLIEGKGYSTNWLTKGDIEKVEFDKTTESYKITVDNAYVGSSKIIDITKQEFEKLKGKEGEVQKIDVDI